MLFTKEELGVINIALKTKETERGIEERRLPDEDLEAGMAVYKAIKVNIENDKFIDGEMSLNAPEKALILKLIKRDWAVELVESKQSLKAKLEAKE